MRRLLAATALVALVGVDARGDGRRIVDAIVVRVNDRIITVTGMRERAADHAAERGQPVPVEAYPMLVQEAADELCLLERAAELKIEISEQEIDAAIQQLREQNRVPDDETFTRMLRDLGMSLPRLRQRLQDNITVNRVLSQEVGELPITEEEVRQRYERDKEKYAIPERYALEHIVYPVAPDRSDLQLKLARARRLVAAARAGGSFLDLVTQETALGDATGGDLGALVLSDLRAEVRDVVAAMKPGDISEPFVSAIGVHVGRLREKFPASYRPFAEVAEELHNRELDERYRNRLRGVVDGLKTRYVVVVHPELFTPVSS
jgi:parvulin-like peptidyl-prolyl isomerase